MYNPHYIDNWGTFMDTYEYLLTLTELELFELKMAAITRKDFDVIEKIEKLENDNRIIRD